MKCHQTIEPLEVNCKFYCNSGSASSMLKKVLKLNHVKTAAVKVPDLRLYVKSLRFNYEGSQTRSDSKISQKASCPKRASNRA